MKIKEKVFITNSPKETQRLGRSFGKTLEKGVIVCLYGNLGFGKTTFIQGLAKGLGIKRRIISPTFIMVRSYKLGVGSFYHVDLYRIENNEINGLGLEEILNDSGNITVIEWAEKLKNYLPEKRIDIKFSYESELVRKISFSFVSK